MRTIASKTILITALAAGLTGFASAPASAQFIGGGWFGNFGPPPFVEPDGVIPMRVVARIMHSRGFRMTDAPARRGNRLYVLAVNDYGQLSSVVMDAYSGTILRAGPVAGTRSAYGAPFGDIDAPANKPKPRVKTAARPAAAPLAGAVPASPPPAPSQALQPPAPVTPVAPPAAAVTPAAAPPAAAPPAAAPAVVAPRPIEAAVPPRPAPDAQPDVGPKVVPVKPAAEAKAPPPPADWDTEAAPKAAPAVTPEQANKMAPERHEDQ